MDKRRLDAVEKVWTTVQALAPFEMLSGMMAAIKIDVTSKLAPTDPKIRQLFEMLGSTIAKPPIQPSAAANEEPFVSPVAWAYFSAYQAVVFSAYAQAKAIEFGLKDSDQLLNLEHVKKLLKTALPHQAEFIENYDRGAYHYLLDELKRALLSELRKMLEGADVDEASITRSASIMKAVSEVVKDRETTLASAAGLTKQ